MPHQAYFTPAAFRFWRTLAKHNNREWFTAHKDDYERHVREPYLALITDMQAPLAKISPHFRADPRKAGGSLYRYFRDARYSHNKMPYKTWQGARFFHERRHEIVAPGFFMNLEPDHCWAGGGLWNPEPDVLHRLREFLADNPEAWKRATRSKAFTSHLDLRGETLKRPPRGFPPEHELIEDLKRKEFVAGADFDEALACSAELLPWLVDCFRRVAPLVDYLCAAQELEF